MTTKNTGTAKNITKPVAKSAGKAASAVTAALPNGRPASMRLSAR
ncbi:hypothetical protein LRU_00778 [Ligilactobacillus ruminis SPM0211]|uniref:Uncharacterized protein n=1 Tax=Ligilactobacillus ruminis SPM0211 TaxID=1040964 RepID=F7QZC4_9LACO|nr:hypothetical protein LRU_00778 [Ligilactobacillus ruminis SPM0211]